MNKEDILQAHNSGKSHTEIAELIIASGEMDDYTEALKVVEAIVLTCKRMDNRKSA